MHIEVSYEIDSIYKPICTNISPQNDVNNMVELMEISSKYSRSPLMFGLPKGNCDVTRELSVVLLGFSVYLE